LSYLKKLDDTKKTHDGNVVGPKWVVLFDDFNKFRVPGNVATRNLVALGARDELVVAIGVIPALYRKNVTFAVVLETVSEIDVAIKIATTLGFNAGDPLRFIGGDVSLITSNIGAIGKLVARRVAIFDKFGYSHFWSLFWDGWVDR